MSENLRRHSILVSDRDLAVLERAVRVYVEVIRIQVPLDQPHHETDDAARVAAVFYGHHSCACAARWEPIIEGAR